MLKKRLVGVVTVAGGRAVQSFGYNRYLPLGRPEVLVENLDRWGADEILVQCIDRSRSCCGPDFATLERISGLGLSTPLIYAGGIASSRDGVAVIKAGADRLCLDAVLHHQPSLATELAELLGAQAIIAALPLAARADHLSWLDYRSGDERVAGRPLLDLLSSGAVSEVLAIDWRNEGVADGFDINIVDRFPVEDVPLIVFGGISTPRQMKSLFQHGRVAAVAVGNFLSYTEHAVQHYKQHLPGMPLRGPCFESPTASKL